MERVEYQDSFMDTLNAIEASQNSLRPEMEESTFTETMKLIENKTHTLKENAKTEKESLLITNMDLFQKLLEPNMETDMFNDTLGEIKKLLNEIKKNRSTR